MDEKSPPPPSASAFLQKHTYQSEDDTKDALSSSGSRGPTEMVSNLIEGLVGGGAAQSGDDDASVNSMKHRKEGSLPYDKRTPKMGYNNDVEGGGGGNPSAVPYRGFGSKASVAPSGAQAAPGKPGPFAGLRYRLRGFFSPRATDIQQLLIKLQAQFNMLEVDHRRYYLMKDGSAWHEEERRFVKEHDSDIINSEDDLKDPNHPLNNSKLISEVHFVGRKAIDYSVIQLTSLMATGDRFGCITELWLNDNLISDEGAAAIASFLQLPTCALVELWLGNNKIGPAGTTLLSAALSNNETSKLNCLGLYLNPIGNGGATSLAQMLRKNHTLSTVDIHGCGSRGKGPEVLEGYGSKVVKGPDGTEYVARVVATSTEEDRGVVTDQRLLDAIQTFVAFNRIDPTREQAIRGIMSSDKQHVQDDGADAKGEGTRTNISGFLSELSNLPAHEKLTGREKQTWKTCEWERLYLAMKRAREAKSALASDLLGNANKDEGNVVEIVEEGGGLVEGKEIIGSDLDDEVVRTDTKSWREVKMGITGTTTASPRPRNSPPPANGKGRSLYSISDDDDEIEAEASDPQSALTDALEATKAAEERGKLEEALETVVPVEEGVKTPEEGEHDAELKF